MPERTYFWTSVEDAREAKGERTNLEYFSALARGELPMQPVSQTVGWRVIHAEAGLVRLALTPEDFHLHGGGVVHGGMLATLMDSAMAAALMTRLQPGEHVTTVQFGMNLIRRVKTGEGDIVAEGRVSYMGKRTCTASARILAADDQLVAEGTCVCMMI